MLNATGWVRLTNCDRHGNVTGTINESCFDTPFTGFIPGYYPARISINYAGCGGYTPTPSAQCGDVEDFNVTLTAC